MKKILVAEDEDAIREFVVINLKRSGYDVFDVNNGSDAVEAYDKSNGVTKPFSPSELMARVDALHRRVALSESSDRSFREELRSGNFVLNLRNRALSKNGELVELTQVEFQIMEYFFSNPRTALSRDDILKHVWGDGFFGEEKIVDVNIRRLRMKIEEKPSSPRHIVTVWGLGYKWEA